MKLMVLLSRVPYPTEKGDKLRAYHQIKQLSKNNEIHLVALSDIKLHPDAIKALSPYCRSVYILRLDTIGIAWNILRAFILNKPLQVGYFYNAKKQRIINKLIQDIQPEHIYCQLIRTAEYVKNTNIPKTIDYQDVFSKGIHRRMENAGWGMKLVFKIEYLRLIRYENWAFSAFDNKIIISKPDRSLIPHPEKEKIYVIPNGVDYDYFQAKPIPKEFDLLFTGNMGYPPNVDAAEFLAHEILPIVHQTHPDTSLVLAGAKPHSRVIALKSNHITVTGWVPDLRYYYARARIFIAPMRIGTGLQNKLLEAMAMQVPCITSPLANNALEAKEGRDVLTATMAKEFAKQIISLLDDEKKANFLAQNGHQYVKSRFDWAESTAQLEKIFQL